MGIKTNEEFTKSLTEEECGKATIYGFISSRIELKKLIEECHKINNQADADLYDAVFHTSLDSIKSNRKNIVSVESKIEELYAILNFAIGDRMEWYETTKYNNMIDKSQRCMGLSLSETSANDVISLYKEMQEPYNKNHVDKDFVYSLYSIVQKVIDIDENYNFHINYDMCLIQIYRTLKNYELCNRDKRKDVIIEMKDLMFDACSLFSFGDSISEFVSFLEDKESRTERETELYDRYWDNELQDVDFKDLQKMTLMYMMKLNLI